MDYNDNKLVMFGKHLITDSDRRRTWLIFLQF